MKVVTSPSSKAQTLEKKEKKRARSGSEGGGQLVGGGGPPPRVRGQRLRPHHGTVGPLYGTVVCVAFAA